MFLQVPGSAHGSQLVCFGSDRLSVHQNDDLRKSEDSLVQTHSLPVSFGPDLRIGRIFTSSSFAIWITSSMADSLCFCFRNPLLVLQQIPDIPSPAYPHRSGGGISGRYPMCFLPPFGSFKYHVRQSSTSPSVAPRYPRRNIHRK